MIEMWRLTYTLTGSHLCKHAIVLAKSKYLAMTEFIATLEGVAVVSVGRVGAGIYLED